MATAKFKKRSATPTAPGSDAASSGPPSAPNHNSSSLSGNSLAFLTTPVGQRRVAKLLELGLNEHQQKLNRDYMESLKSGFVDWLTANLKDTESRLAVSYTHLTLPTILLV